MALLDANSFYQIIKLMNQYPYLSVLAGFDELNPLSSSTLYDFCSRFLNSHSHSQNPKPSTLARGDKGRFWRLPYDKPKDHPQDEPNVELSAAQKAVQKVFAVLEEGLSQDLTTQINALLWALVCQRSLDKGYLGDPLRLVVSADASCFESLSNGFGKKHATVRRASVTMSEFTATLTRSGATTRAMTVTSGGTRCR
jgi:hypothetical protein